MGNDQSTNTVPLSSPNFAPQVDILRRLHTPHYGDIKLVKDVRSGEEWILKEVVLNTKEAFQSEVAFYDKRVTEGHPNIVKICGYTSVDKQNFCSTYYKLSIYIEVLAKDLEGDLAERSSVKINYTEGELLLIAYNLVTALASCQLQSKSHDDVRPFNIFITSGQNYKLSDPSLNANHTNGLTNAILGNAKSLLAPELMSNVPVEKFDASYDHVKADVFSLGVTLLSLATLENSETLYNYTEGKIDFEDLKRRLQKVQESYSNFTYELIRDMLVENPEERVDFIAIENRLDRFKEAIVRREDLDFYAKTGKAGEEKIPEPKGEEDNFESAGVVQHQEKRPAVVHSALPDEDVKVETNTPTTDALQRAEEQLAKSQQLRNDGNTGGSTSTYTYTPINYDTDDLEARIKAALERSQQTFKQIFADQQEAGSSSYKPADYTYTPINYGTTDYATTTYNAGTTANAEPNTGATETNYGNYNFKFDYGTTTANPETTTTNQQPTSTYEPYNFTYPQATETVVVQNHEPVATTQPQAETTAKNPETNPEPVFDYSALMKQYEQLKRSEDFQNQNQAAVQQGSHPQ